MGEIVTGLMMTALALYSEAESPLGQVGFLAEDGEEVDEDKEAMIETIKENFQLFEYEERQRGVDQREALQLAMRQIAARGQNG